MRDESKCNQVESEKNEKTSQRLGRWNIYNAPYHYRAVIRVTFCGQSKIYCYKQSQSLEEIWTVYSLCSNDMAAEATSVTMTEMCIEHIDACLYQHWERRGRIIASLSWPWLHSECHINFRNTARSCLKWKQKEQQYLIVQFFGVHLAV